MSPLEAYVLGLQQTWPAVSPAAAYAATTLISLTDLFDAPPALVLGNFAYLEVS